MIDFKKEDRDIKTVGILLCISILLAPVAVILKLDALLYTVMAGLILIGSYSIYRAIRLKRGT